jgi:hypothetical protein
VKLVGKVGILKFFSISLIALLAGALGLGGCAKLRRTSEAEGNAAVTDAVVFRGYRSTVTVHAAPEQLKKFFSTREGLTKLGVFRSVKSDPAGDITQLGRKLQARMRVRGVEFPITFTNIKATEDKDGNEFWIANSHPFTAIQRWRVRPGREGSEIDLTLMSEEPTSWAGRAVDSSEMFDEFCGVMDTALAHVQANFDPKFNLRAALSNGRRGELYQVLLKNLTVESRIAASPARVFNYLKEHNSFAGLLGETRANPDCQGRLDLPYCPLHSTIAGRETPVNQFVAGYKSNEEITYLLVWADYLALVQVKLTPQAKGRASLVKASFAVEIPGSALDLLWSLTKVPERMTRTLTGMKQDLEKVN